VDAVLAQAAELSRAHAARFFARSLDLIHVASAHLLQCGTFGSADDRQLAVAKTTGLKTVDIKKPIGRKGTGQSRASCDPYPSKAPRGWTKDTVKPGDVITGVGYRFADGQRGSGSSVQSVLDRLLQ
jgi:hypothetical protein